MAISYAGVSLGVNANDDDMQKFQKEISAKQDFAVSRDDRFQFMRTKGLESILNAYLDCRARDGNTPVIPSIEPSGPAKTVIVTLQFHSPLNPVQQAKIVAEPITLGLIKTSTSSKFSKDAVITNRGAHRGV
jgi:hypothetical protein